MFNIFNSIDINQLHMMIIILLILFVIFFLINRKKNNRILCEGLKILFIFFIGLFIIVSINLFGKKVGKKVITI